MQLVLHKIYLASFVILFVCCSNEHRKSPQNYNLTQNNKEAIKKQFIKANQQLIQKEKDELDYYEKTHKLSFINTNSGVRYFVYHHSAKGDSIRDSTEIIMSYRVNLLDGTECYSSEISGKKKFVVGMEEIESGIHIGVKYLKRGDKALILIPSHLAHGLLGDFKKIPPQMPIVYDVKIE